ncbi:hypothetical protein QL285_026142 [Trifolium repens]|nr:hypothetical protein QL285_026142 [Trifolium repens]
MLNDRRSFCRFSIFASFVRRDARELSVRFVVRVYGKYLVRIDLDLIQWLGCDLRTLSYLIQWPKSSKTFISGGLRIITSSLLLSLLAVSFFSTFPTCEVLHSFTISLD